MKFVPRLGWWLAASAYLTPAMAVVASEGDEAGDPAAAAVVDVIGKRPETSHPDRPGVGLLIRPEDASRFDSTAVLRQDASLSVPDTGRITAAGFSVPRVRGEDVRLTDLYVGDIRLTDPYTGLPLVDELDLRAFGELAVYTGVPPADLPTVNSIGVLQYRLRPLQGNEVEVGTTVGRPYGAMAWGLMQQAFGEWQARVYVRRHQTDGVYQAYDDHGTPFNTNDDRNRMVTGDQRRSTQVMPVVTGPVASGRLTVLALVESSETGLPPPLTTVAANAVGDSTAALLSGQWRAPDGLGLKLSVNRDERETRDPSGLVLGPQGASGLKVTGAMVGVEQLLGTNYGDFRVGMEASRADVTASQAAGVAAVVAREILTVYASMALRLDGETQIETKLLGRALEDSAQGGGQNDSVSEAPPMRRSLNGGGATLALSHRLDSVSPYAQLGYERRAPTLLEEYGDSALVRPNPQIEPETARHGEVGLTWRPPRWSWGKVGGTASFFRDRTLDRIVLVPSLAQSVRALNIGVAQIDGAEARADVESGVVGAFAGVSRFFPEDQSLPGHTRPLPMVANLQATGGASLAFGEAKLRLTSRYRSQVYRDEDESLELPAYWIHDATLDAPLLRGTTRADLAIAILNLGDVRALPIAASGPSDQHGMTPYADDSGYPLPGRQWRVSLVLAF